MTMDEDESQPRPTDRTPIGDVVEPEPVVTQDPYPAGEEPKGGAVLDGEETPENGGP